jgi:hypothetical protein
MMLIHNFIPFLVLLIFACWVRDGDAMMGSLSPGWWMDGIMGDICMVGE